MKVYNVIVFSRSIGQSLVFNREDVFTLAGMEAGIDWVTLTKLDGHSSATRLSLSENQTVELFPTIRVTLLAMKTERMDGARFGVEVPRDIPVYRGEMLESHGHD